MRYLIDVIAFLVGYVILSRQRTGGGVVSPSVLTRGGDATSTVIICVVTGLLGVLLWRVARLGTLRLRREG